MTSGFAKESFPILLTSIRERLQEALATAKAAEAYLAEAQDDRNGALSLALELEIPLTEASTLLGAMAIIQRRSRCA